MFPARKGVTVLVPRRADVAVCDTLWPARHPATRTHSPTCAVHAALVVAQCLLFFLESVLCEPQFFTDNSPDTPPPHYTIADEVSLIAIRTVPSRCLFCLFSRSCSLSSLLSWTLSIQL